MLIGHAHVAQSQDLTSQPSPAAQALLRQGVELVYQDRFDEAIGIFRKAVAISPRYLRAHVEYIRTRAYFQEAYNEVRAEYEALMAKEPDNPIYPIALVLGAGNATSNRINRARYEKVVALAPDWAWGHYAKAQLLSKDPNAASVELLKAIEKDPSGPEPYRRLIFLQESQLKRVDDAILTAERMTSQTELRPEGLAILWRLRLGQAQAAEDARAKLKAELDQLAAVSQDVNLLRAVRGAYESQLNDRIAAKEVEKRILQIDPAWYPWRGVANAFGPASISGVSRYELIGGRQVDLFFKVREIDEANVTPKEKISKLEALLSLKPGRVIKRFVYETLFKLAAKEKDTVALQKYGNELILIDPTDVAVPATIALLLAEHDRTLAKAMRYARQADDATREFRPLLPKANADTERLKDGFPEETQRSTYLSQRALSLDAHGWVLYKTQKYRAAEAKLRQAVQLGRSESNLHHLAEALRKLGRAEEAAQVAIEAENEFAAVIGRQLTSQDSKDFQLEALDGRKFTLSNLKGQVVVVNFWSTSCLPCLSEMPHLVKLYEEYRNRGVEILAIATDDAADHSKVVAFAKDYKLSFPVLYDQGVQQDYQVNGIPTTFFLDKQGKVRYRNVGFSGPETVRLTEVIVNELLK